MRVELLTGRAVVMQFRKYEALGNDYLVIEAHDLEGDGLPAALVCRICDRHRGIGADGILLDVSTAGGDHALRIFNPDGSEAEKSGNGLRIFARFLWDQGRVGAEPFPVLTKGGAVVCEVRNRGREVFVEMGRATFDSALIPVAGSQSEVVEEVLEIDGVVLRYTAVSLGNPHCVVQVEETSAELAQRLGPLLESHPLFPRRTNVQFVQVFDRKRLRIEIWERGAGYTLASGSSACAAAAACVRLGLCDRDLTVLMPGGQLAIGVSADYSLTMLGRVSKVAEGKLAVELLTACDATT